MGTNLIIAAVLIVIFVAIAVHVFVRSRSEGGLFGAPIQMTVGEVTDSRHPKVVSLKIHILGEPPERAVGVELSIKAPGLGMAVQNIPVVLSANEAKKLSSLLQAAHERKTYNYFPAQK